MSQTAKSASSQGTDAKDKGAPAPAATSKATKTGEPGMGSFRVSRIKIRLLNEQYFTTFCSIIIYLVLFTHFLMEAIIQQGWDQIAFIYIYSQSGFSSKFEH